MATLMHQNSLCTCITRSLRKVQWVAMPRMLAFKVSRLMIIRETLFWSRGSQHNHGSHGIGNSWFREPQVGGPQHRGDDKYVNYDPRGGS